MTTLRLDLLLSTLVLALSVLAFLSVDPYTGYPAPDAPSYEQLSQRLAAGDGYGVDLPGEPAGSRYPPGFPVLLAALSPLLDAGRASVVIAAALPIASWWAAWKVSGPAAAAFTALLLSAYLPRHQYAGAVMADTTGALFVVLSLIALLYGRRVLAGALTGFGAWIRVAHLALAVTLPRRSLPPFAVLVGGLALTKVRWSWGYESGSAQWAFHHIVATDQLVGDGKPYPNIVAYPLMLAGLHRSICAPGAVLVAGWALWRRPERAFVLLTVGALLLVYTPYFVQDDRFLLPAAALVAIYAGVGLVRVVGLLNPLRSPRNVA